MERPQSRIIVSVYLLPEALEEGEFAWARCFLPSGFSQQLKATRSGAGLVLRAEIGDHVYVGRCPLSFAGGGKVRLRASEVIPEAKI